MYKKRIVAFLAALLLFAAAVAALPVTVAFVDGTVEVQSKGAWKVLDFGDSFDSSQTVRLGSKAVLELSIQGGDTLVLGNAGVYVIDTLIKKKAPAGVVATVAAKLEKIAKGAGQESTAGGVRAEDVSDLGAELLWAGAGNEAEAMYNAGINAYDEMDYPRAWELCLEAIRMYKEAADPAGAARAAWYASLSGLASGSGAKALSALRQASPDDAAALRGSYVLALATLNAQYGSPEEAKTLLKHALDEHWFDDPSMEHDARSLLADL